MFFLQSFLLMSKNESIQAIQQEAAGSTERMQGFVLQLQA
jgi:hypothetical protein